MGFGFSMSLYRRGGEEEGKGGLLPHRRFPVWKGGRGEGAVKRIENLPRPSSYHPYIEGEKKGRGWLPCRAGELGKRREERKEKHARHQLLDRAFSPH